MLPAIALSALLSTTLALPLSTTNHQLGPRSVHQLNVNGLLSIAPTSRTCSGAPFPSECRTASQALPHILASFRKYHITHPAVQAALVSLMAYESGEFRYNINHYPGVVGQGTRNMQSPEFNAQYAASQDLGTPAQREPDEVMSLVGDDEHSFASAAWFVTSQCPLATREAMWSGSEQAWASYLTNCVGAEPSEAGRKEYWERAKVALGV